MSQMKVFQKSRDITEYTLFCSIAQLSCKTFGKLIEIHQL